MRRRHCSEELLTDGFIPSLWQERAAGASEREHLPRVGRAPDDEAVLQRGATVVRMLRAAGSSREERRAKLAAANRGLLRACLSEAERFSLDDALLSYTACDTNLPGGLQAREAARPQPAYPRHGHPRNVRILPKSRDFH